MRRFACRGRIRRFSWDAIPFSLDQIGCPTVVTRVIRRDRQGYRGAGHRRMVERGSELQRGAGIGEGDWQWAAARQCGVVGAELAFVTRWYAAIADQCLGDAPLGLVEGGSNCPR